MFKNDKVAWWHLINKNIPPTAGLCFVVNKINLNVLKWRQHENETKLFNNINTIQLQYKTKSLINTQSNNGINARKIEGLTTKRFWCIRVNTIPVCLDYTKEKMVNFEGNVITTVAAQHLQTLHTHWGCALGHVVIGLSAVLWISIPATASIVTTQRTNERGWFGVYHLSSPRVDNSVTKINVSGAFASLEM